MIKRMLVLALVMVFGLSGSSFAGAVALSDKALDGVSAGDWITVKDAEGNEEAVDVYTTNNTLDLLDEAQKDIQAVSNANAVDAAIAVQTNIARVTGDTPTDNVAVNGTNEANIVNYRPAASSSTMVKTGHSVAGETVESFAQSSSEKCALSGSMASDSSSSASAASSKALNYNETLDASAALASSGREIGKGISTSAVAATALVDYDKVITYVESASAANASAAASNAVLGITKEVTNSTVSGKTVKTQEADTSETVIETRDSKGVNNHIILDSTSQQTIKAVSNLNAVGAGAAVQNNIASNVGVSGSITHVNSASVQSGF